MAAIFYLLALFVILGIFFKFLLIVCLLFIPAYIISFVFINIPKKKVGELIESLKCHHRTSR